ncbi:g5776 [Coccomyxa viridis]|uniref:G5776 protein n=1 Tax=Coccomyxa viridis TaxID=1274662 RepID=A0ABP1FYL4_9CHLO
MFKTPSEVSLPRVQSLPSLRPCRAASHSAFAQSSAALPQLTRRDGEFFLVRRSEHSKKKQHIVSHGSITLPAGVGPGSFSVDKQVFKGQSLVEAHVSWSSNGSCVARMSIYSSDIASSRYDWCKSIEGGYTVEYRVHKAAASQAEIKLDIESAGHWFGGGHLMRQLWPLNRASLETGPFYPFDNGPNGVNTLVAPQWLTSQGLLVMTDPDTPFLHVGMNAPRADGEAGWIQRSWGVGVQNMAREYLPRSALARAAGDGLLRLQARASYKCHLMQHPLHDWMPAIFPLAVGADAEAEHSWTTMRVAICAAEDAKAACQLALRTMTPPRLSPSKELLEAPIWTTWARYFSRVSQAKVLKYAHEIVSRNLQRSVMEIDDRWQSAYGDLEFDSAKFPDAPGMVRQLHAMGFKVTVWVMPFVEENSAAYREGSTKGYFVTSTAPGLFMKPGFFRWWNTAPVVALDVTNPEAVAWFVYRLRKLQTETGIDGFKFDAGEPCFLPQQFRTHKPIASPIEYTHRWVSEVAGQFQGGVCEVRTGHKTQGIALFTRMGDRFSTWDVSNGLQSIIPTLLTSSVAGYPFCLPDMIGGNAYFGQKPTHELMVRWTQLNALMPALQFSIAPWDLSEETAKLCAEAVALRKKVIGRLHVLADLAARTLTPIARPMWWLDPRDEATFTIHDQFALGDDFIVAPVVERGATTRNIYLTQGLWRDPFDEGSEQTWEGPAWLPGFPAPLNKLPCFERVRPNLTQPSSAIHATD